VRAIQLHGTGDLRLNSVPPPPAADSAVIEVDACGLCGSDLHFIDGSALTAHLPITLGHEATGTVVYSPDSALAVGTPVVAEIGGFCHTCVRCREGRPNLCQRVCVLGIDVDGGFADQIAVPVESLVVRPDGVPPAAAATASDAGATALHAIERRARVAPDDSVLIIGAGGLGTYGLQWARIAGAGLVIVADTDPEALTRAKSLGADELILVEPGVSVGRQVKLLSDGGVDAAIEFVGAAATADAAIKSIRPGGRAVIVGVGSEPLASLPIVLWSNHEYNLLGSYGSYPGDTARVLRALEAGTVTPPATHLVPLADATELIMSLVNGARREATRYVVVP
jgi:alcohol dehydrogenase, propanol-preferring